MTDKTDMAQLGMFLDWSEPTPDEDGVFGRDIAVEGFCEALVRYAGMESIRFFRNSPVLRGVSAVPHPLQAMAGENVQLSFAEMRDLKRDFNAHPFELWHDMDGNLNYAHDLRARFADRLYPITATPHVFSYATLGHSWMLRMLLQPLQACDSMICPTPSAKQAFSNLAQGIAEALQQSHKVKLRFKPRLDIIPLGVDTTLFCPRSKPELRQQLDLPQDAVLLMWIGRLSPLDKADLLPLLRVFADLCRDNADVPLYLFIGGSGHRFVTRMLHDYAERLGLRDKVIFRMVPAHERHLYHSAADVFLSPADSIQETFGITPIEAMACGVPQVVSDWDGYRDGVVDGVTGFLIPTLMGVDDDDISRAAGVYDGYDMFDHFQMGQRTVVDTDMLRQRLQALIENPDLRNTMAEASRKRALERYDWRVIIGAYEALWAELKAVAANTRPQAKVPDYEGLRLSRIFGHYATQPIDITTRHFAITAAGERLFSEKQVMPAYYKALGYLSVDSLNAILHVLRNGAEDYATLVQKSGLKPEAQNPHLYWLLKMGFVAASPVVQEKAKASQLLLEV